MSIPVSLVRSVTATKVAPAVLAWDELVAWLTEDHIHNGPKDTLPGWIPAEFNGAARGNDNVKHVTVGVIDLDHVTDADIEELHDRLRALQLDYIWHTSYTHGRTCVAHNKTARKAAGARGQDTPAECPDWCDAEKIPKYRFVLRLSRPVAPADWLKVWAGLAHVAPRIDPACKDPTRLYFVPGRREGTPWDAGSYAGGQTVDVDALIQRAALQGPQLSVVGDAPTERAWRRLGETHANGMSAARAIGGRAMLALLDQEPFAPEGQRDTALFQMAAILADKYPHSAPALLVDLVRAELLKQTENERWAEGDGAAELEAKIERLQGQRGERGEGERQARLDQLGREGPYTEAEIREYVFQLGLRDADQLRMQLIVSCRGTLYVFYEGRYYYAGSKDNAEELVRHRLQVAVTLPGVTLQEVGPKGIAEKTFAKLLRDYGTPVEEVSASLTAASTHLELLARPTRLVVATAPRDRRRVAQYSVRAEAWLQRLAGDAATSERLLDWLATAPRLERATSALYLHGARRTGKSTLANGLALVWGQRPTELEEVGSAFNDHVAKSPVVFADESLPFEWKQDSGKLRRLVTATTHSLRQKYQDNRSLDGALRVILAANNLGLLYSPGETLDQWDIEALCERVFYVNAGARTAEHLPTEELADHILWLEATRKVQADGRLWVSGVDSPLHRALRTRGRHRAAVCQWLLKFVENPKLALQHQKRWRMDAEGLFVAPRLLHATWGTYMEGERALELPQLTAALYEISERDVIPGLVRVRLDDLSQFAAQHTWGQFETLEELHTAVSAGGALK